MNTRSSVARDGLHIALAVTLTEFIDYMFREMKGFENRDNVEIHLLTASRELEIRPVGTSHAVTPALPLSVHAQIDVVFAAYLSFSTLQSFNCVE